MRTGLTLFIILLIILPIPPSTIIGTAIIAHPKTNQHLCPRLLAPVLAVTAKLNSIIRK